MIGDVGWNQWELVGNHGNLFQRICSRATSNQWLLAVSMHLSLNPPKHRMVEITVGWN